MVNYVGRIELDGKNECETNLERMLDECPTNLGKVVDLNPYSTNPPFFSTQNGFNPVEILGSNLIPTETKTIQPS